MKNKSSAGFTIVELLVVIVVIGILAAITIVSYTGITQRANIASLTSDLANASTQLKIDQTINGLYPTDLTSANGGKGIPASSGTSYQYSYNNNANPQTFCITATKGITSYRITNDNPPIAGDCFNYGLILYLDAGNSASYPGNGTTWTDLSGSGANGTLINNVTYNSSNGGSLMFDGVSSYVSSSVSQNYLDMILIFKPDFSLINSNSLAGVVANGVNTDESLRFTNVSGVGPWYIPNPGNVNDWASSSTTYYVNGSVANQLAVGWNIFGGYRTNQTTYPSNFAYYLGSGLGGRYFKGNIAAILMFNRRLSASDYQRYFNVFRSRYGL